MHQSPQKKSAGRRDKYADQDLPDAQAERRLQRGSQPKARKFALREEYAREARLDRKYDR
ncbi:MAG: hypothetical protein JWQ07_2439 [Ramlibacter sp.]|nr:hypothetical protein [Ramlibacter sp.]